MKKFGVDIDEEKKVLKEHFKNDIKEVIYWNKIRKKFAAKNKLKSESFKMEFKHDDIHSNYDNEIKIQAYADEYGYKIVNEELLANKSIYEFAKK